MVNGCCVTFDAIHPNNWSCAAEDQYHYARLALHQLEHFRSKIGLWLTGLVDELHVISDDSGQ